MNPFLVCTDSSCVCVYLRRKAIEVLKKDNAALKEELRLENKHSVVPTAASGSALLAQLQSESDILTRKVVARLTLLTYRASPKLAL